MESVYAAILLHKTGQKINEENLSKVLTAAKAKVDEAKIKALVAALEGVNIEEAMKKAVVAAAPAAVGTPTVEAKPEKAKKDEKKKEEEEEVSAGLGALFG
jgi:large subunit ribosomal protein L12